MFLTLKRFPLVIVLALLCLRGFSQPRSVNPLTLEKTYMNVEIHLSLRNLVNGYDKANYFDDDFHNNFIRKLITDKNFTEREKAQLFYLIQKKVGYAFVGVEYLPPKQSYFTYHTGKVYIYEKTKASLKDLNYDVNGLLTIVDSNFIKDPVLASNALFLACLLNTDKAQAKLEQYSKSEWIRQSKNPDILNHYVCLGASLLQNETIVKNLISNLDALKYEGMIEDALCAIHARNNPVSLIRDYVLSEKNPDNDLAIETALCALNSKVPIASFKQSVKSLMEDSKDTWKLELLKKIMNEKIPFGYSLTDSEQLSTKIWNGVTVSFYTDGALISNGSLMEFDPN